MSMIPYACTFWVSVFESHELNLKHPTR